MRPGLRITVLDWITGIFSLFKKFHLLSSSLYIFRQTGTHTHTHISFWNTFLHIVADFRKRQKANKADLLKPLNSYSNYLVMLNMKLKIFDTKPVYIIKVFSLDKLLPWVFSRKSPKSFLFIWHCQLSGRQAVTEPGAASFKFSFQPGELMGTHSCV